MADEIEINILALHSDIADKLVSSVFYFSYLKVHFSQC